MTIPTVACTGAGSTRLDLALSDDDRHLYALTAGTGTLTGFRVGANGSLNDVGTVVEQPAASGQDGLAAF